MTARQLQEPVLRYVVSAAFLGCSVAFCATVGDVDASTSIGLFFGLFIAAVPTAWLWGRELQEIQVRSDRRNNSAQPRRFNADVGDVSDAPPDRQPTEQTTPVRSTYYDDDDD